MMKKVCMGFSFLVCSSAWALTPVSDGSTNIFSTLQVTKAQSNMELDIAKLKLQRLQLQIEIDKLIGSPKATQNTINLKVKNISVFNNNKKATIDIDGAVKTYTVGDVLKGSLTIQDISNKSVKVLNTVTNKTSIYLIS